MNIKILITAVSLSCLLLSCGPKDENIQKEINVKMTEFPGVDVMVHKGVATISGICKDAVLKGEVENMLKKIKGVKEVVNNCEIAPENTVIVPDVPVEIAADSALTLAVNDLLKSYKGISANVQDGVVTLMGTATRAQLQPLMQSVQELKPKKVENKLTIK